MFNYQYMLDPRVAAMVTRDMERECIVVFDEAHNIDNVCIEALRCAGSGGGGGAGRLGGRGVRGAAG